MEVRFLGILCPAENEAIFLVRSNSPVQLEASQRILSSEQQHYIVADVIKINLFPDRIPSNINSSPLLSSVEQWFTALLLTLIGRERWRWPSLCWVRECRMDALLLSLPSSLYDNIACQGCDQSSVSQACHNVCSPVAMGWQAGCKNNKSVRLSLITFACQHWTDLTMSHHHSTSSSLSLDINIILCWSYFQIIFRSIPCQLLPAPSLWLQPSDSPYYNVGSDGNCEVGSDQNSDREGEMLSFNALAWCHIFNWMSCSLMVIVIAVMLLGE